MNLFTDFATPLIHTFRRCCIQSCSLTLPLICSTRRRRTFCAALHVSVVMVPLWPSLSILMLLDLGMRSRRSDRPGNSFSVISCHRNNRCLSLSNWRWIRIETICENTCLISASRIRYVFDLPFLELIGHIAPMFHSPHTCMTIQSLDQDRHPRAKQ